MAKKSVKTVKTATASAASGKSCCGVCSEAKWNLAPLRIALGLMFFVAGLIKLIDIVGGGSQTSGFFANIGVPLPVFSAWLVMIVEVVGGIFLMIGFLTWWVGLLAGIIMIVALLLTTLNPLNWSSLTKHLVYIAGLVAVMYGNGFFSVKKCCCK